MSNSTLGIVKPHAVVDGQLGAIVADIQAAGFTIAAMHSFTLDRANAEEFLEVYKVRGWMGGLVEAFVSPMIFRGLCQSTPAWSQSWNQGCQWRWRWLAAVMSTPAFVNYVALWVRCMLVLVLIARFSCTVPVFVGNVYDTDPEVARHLRPATLRAKYGLNKVQSAMHCTDLPEDCALETEYFFAILLE